MRITQQLLRSRANAPLQQVEFLDLSNLGLVSVEKLNTCPKLQTLNLRGNSIVEVVNLEENRNLWNLDLSNNEIKDLDCLSKFVAMGMVNLANNDLTWAEVAKLRNTHILELNLHGNKQLEKDPYYRIHVIDCLPNIWMLDGRMVTSAERLQVKHFFADSALTEHPIRKKLTKEWFVPSSLKKIDVNGIYGEKATHMMIRFPASGPSNVDSDRRRLKYLAHNVEDDLVLEKKYSKRDFQVLKYRRTFIQDILEARSSDRERCNMLVLLLVATLEFVMPTHLVKETLEVAKLSKIGRVYSMDLFLLPKDIRCRIVCILLGAVKVDKDTKEDGGLYDRLYLCLFYTVAELAKLSNSIFGKQNVPTFKMTQLYRDYKCLLASEIVQLLCIVPAFFEYIERDVGVMNLLVTATGDPMITEKVAHLTNSVLEAGGDTKKLYEELSDFLLQRVQEQSLNLNNKKLQISHEEQVITNTKSIPMKSPRSPLDAADFHMKGVSSPNLDPPSVLSARRQAEREKKHFPRLGDYLLLGPQTLGKVIGLPQPFVAHVAMDSIPVANGAMESKLRESEDHYTYVNMDQLDYDNDLGFWKPRGSIGDNMLQEFLAYSNGVSRFTIHTLDDLRKELNRRANLVGDQLPRPNSPEESRGYVGSPTLTGRDTATPLLFSSGRQSMAEDLLHRRTNTFQAEYTPRPMTSVLKEKMDLKVDFSSVRRVQSARPMEQPIHNSPEPSPDTKDDVLEKNSPECLHCVLDAAEVTSQQQQDPVKVVEEKESNQSANTNRFESKPDETQKEETSQQSKESEGTREPQQAESTSPGPVPNGLPAEEGPKGTTPSLTGASQDVPQAGDQAIVHSEEEPELQILVTSRLEGPTSALGNKVMNQGAKMEDINTKKSNSSLKINIPQMELHEEAYDSARKGRPPHMQGRQTFNTARVPLKTGKLSMQGKNRPFSAMDAYRYIVEHPRKPIGSADNLYNTSYQQQRMEAWRKSASTTASHSHTPRQGTPPPQRPPSPDNKSRPGSGVTVTRANDWLAGGRDLFWESLQKRPRSGHVPGWKEGLPDSMKRPRSAVAARTLNRQSKRSHPVTPSSLAYDAMMQGPRHNSPRSTPRGRDLPHMLNLTDYQPLHQHLGLPRRLGSASSAHDNPTQDTVYRMPPSSPKHERGSRSHSTVSTARLLAIQSIYEQEEVENMNTEP